jgi:hypothetical protein
MLRRSWLTVALVLAVIATGTLSPLAAVDISGKWTASFDTQIGRQDYTYDFVAKDGKLTGHMKSNLGESDVLDGKVDGDKVTFGELLKFEGMEVRISYTGSIVSADEIKFTRNVADFATEELVAKRVK